MKKSKRLDGRYGFGVYANMGGGLTGAVSYKGVSSWPTKSLAQEAIMAMKKRTPHLVFTKTLKV